VAKLLEQQKEDSLVQNVFASFYAYASNQIEKLEKDITDVDKLYMDLLKYYAEPPGTPCDAFFEMWTNFLKNVEQALETNRIRNAKKLKVPVLIPQVKQTYYPTEILSVPAHLYICEPTSTSSFYTKYWSLFTSAFSSTCQYTWNIILCVRQFPFWIHQRMRGLQ